MDNVNNFSDDKIAERRDRARRAIGKRTQKSKQTVPHFYISRTVNMKEAVDFRARWGEVNAGRKSPTFTSLLLRAAALSAEDFQPLFTSEDEISGAKIQDINIGVVTKTDFGLMIPVIKGVNRKSVVEISEELKDVTERARRGILKSGDMGSKHLTISNAGMYGVDTIYPIIDIPDPLIIGVGALKNNAVVTTNGIEIMPQMVISLSVDHCCLDGVDAGLFLQKITNLLEDNFRSVEK